MSPSKAAIEGRCYCGASHIASAEAAEIVTYCHCSDCKRWTGAPAPAFAAFPAQALDLSNVGVRRENSTGTVARWNCAECASPMAAQFDYLPDQIYVPLGILKNAPDLVPSLHCHAEHRLTWLDDDGLPKAEGSGRETLRQSK